MRVIISIILIIASVVLFFSFTDAKYETVQELRAEDQQFDQALERSQELRALRNSLLDKYSMFPIEDLNRLNRLLPDNIDVVRLIIDIDSIADRYNMALEGISVGEPTNDAPSRTLGPSTDTFGSVALSFTVGSDYQKFLAFLADMERSLRLVDVISITFGGLDQQGIGKYTVTINTYWLK